MVLSTLTLLEALHVTSHLCSRSAGRHRVRPRRNRLFLEQRHGTFARSSRPDLHQLGEQRDLPALGRRLEQASQGAGHLVDARPGWLLHVDVL